jgi:tetratricopeptide (TPR) repeat protein
MTKLLRFLPLLLILIFSCTPNPRKTLEIIEQGRLLINKADYPGAIEAFSRAIDYDNESYEAYFLRGTAKFNINKPKEAVEDFLKATEIKPDYADAWFNLGQIMEIEQDMEMACYYYNKAKEFGRHNMGDYLRNCP